MLNRLLGIVFLAIILGVVGCTGGDHLFLEKRTDTTRLVISRSVSMDTDPILVILAKEITFDYNQRTITAGGLINIRGDDGAFGDIWVLPDVSIQDNKLIFKIPDDNAYSVYIGKNHHYLPVVNKE